LLRVSSGKYLFDLASVEMTISTVALEVEGAAPEVLVKSGDTHLRSPSNMVFMFIPRYELAL
jgi:hypothetical protein